MFDPQQPFDRVWPLWWRVAVLGLSVIAIVPLPWAAPWFVRWFVERIEVPDRQRVSFEGKPGDIWYIFVGYGLCTYVSAGLSLKFNGFVSLLLIPLTTFFALIITRWFFANLVWAGRAAPLQFTGSYVGLLGWSVLAPLSFITIIGWAWVYAAWGRWLCKNVTGMHRQFAFTATGWGLSVAHSPHVHPHQLSADRDAVGTALVCALARRSICVDRRGGAARHVSVTELSHALGLSLTQCATALPECVAPASVPRRTHERQRPRCPLSG